VVITGTGRCGTTFLVELLTHLGLETGFNASDIESMKKKRARVGLERDIRRADCPFIVKSPWFCDYAEEVIHRDDITIEHVFIPIRDLYAAAESRRRVSHTRLSGLSFMKRVKQWVAPRNFPGGLWHTRSSEPGEQEVILLGQIYKLVLAIADTKIPMTLMRYPRIVKDPRYLFEKFKPILRDIPYESFYAVFNKTVRPELVHSFNEKDE
jgi:hypothetical protein